MLKWVARKKTHVVYISLFQQQVHEWLHYSVSCLTLLHLLSLSFDVPPLIVALHFKCRDLEHYYTRKPLIYPQWHASFKSNPDDTNQNPHTYTRTVILLANTTQSTNTFTHIHSQSAHSRSHLNQTRTTAIEISLITVIIHNRCKSLHITRAHHVHTHTHEYSTETPKYTTNNEQRTVAIRWQHANMLIWVESRL